MPSWEEDLTRAQDLGHRVTDAEGRSPQSSRMMGGSRTASKKICPNLTMYFNILREYISEDFGGHI